jgi:hypothetical protein
LIHPDHSKDCYNRHSKHRLASSSSTFYLLTLDTSSPHLHPRAHTSSSFKRKLKHTSWHRWHHKKKVSRPPPEATRLKQRATSTRRASRAGGHDTLAGRGGQGAREGSQPITHPSSLNALGTLLNITQLPGILNQPHRPSPPCPPSACPQLPTNPTTPLQPVQS